MLFLAAVRNLHVSLQIWSFRYHLKCLTYYDRLVLDIWLLSLPTILLQWLEQLKLKEPWRQFLMYTHEIFFTLKKTLLRDLNKWDSSAKSTSPKQDIEKAVGSLQVWAPAISRALTSLMPVLKILQRLLCLSCLFLSDKGSDNNPIHTGFNATVASRFYNIKSHFYDSLISFYIFKVSSSILTVRIGSSHSRCSL